MWFIPIILIITIDIQGKYLPENFDITPAYECINALSYSRELEHNLEGKMLKDKGPQQKEKKEEKVKKEVFEKREEKVAKTKNVGGRKKK